MMLLIEVKLFETYTRLIYPYMYIYISMPTHCHLSMPNFYSRAVSLPAPIIFLINPFRKDNFLREQSPPFLKKGGSCLIQVVFPRDSSPAVSASRRVEGLAYTALKLTRWHIGVMSTSENKQTRVSYTVQPALVRTCLDHL